MIYIKESASQLDTLSIGDVVVVVVVVEVAVEVTMSTLWWSECLCISRYISCHWGPCDIKS